MNKEKEQIRKKLEKLEKYIKFLNILKDLGLENQRPNLGAFLKGNLNRLSKTTAKNILNESLKKINDLYEDLKEGDIEMLSIKEKSLLFKMELKNAYERLLKEFREDITFYNLDRENANLDFNKEIWVLRMISYKVNFERKQKEDRYFLELVDYCLFKSDLLEEMLDLQDEEPKNYFYHKMKISEIIEELSNFENHDTLVYFKKYALINVYHDAQYLELLKVSDFNNENKIN